MRRLILLVAMLTFAAGQIVGTLASTGEVNEKTAVDETSNPSEDWTNTVEFVEVPDPMDDEWAISIAKGLTNFRGLGKEPVEGVVSVPDEEGADEDTNEYQIKNWISNYTGEFTDYTWRAERIDTQTRVVVCEISLDGIKYDFRFRVNPKLGTCRYEGGTAFEKLRSSQRKTSWWPW